MLALLAPVCIVVGCIVSDGTGFRREIVTFGGVSLSNYYADKCMDRKVPSLGYIAFKFILECLARLALYVVEAMDSIPCCRRYVRRWMTST